MYTEPDCIKQVTVFEVQWTNCPVEVKEEVKRLWKNCEFGNDYFYYNWEAIEDSDSYPLIHEYLSSRGVTECLIHWWW